MGKGSVQSGQVASYHSVFASVEAVRPRPNPQSLHLRRRFHDYRGE